MFARLCCLAHLLCLFAIAAHAAEPHAVETQDALLLHSYHKGMLWADGITAGVEDELTLEPNGVDLHVEYMDAKRFGGDALFDRLADLYAHKYAGTPLRVVLTADDLALRFALAHRERLFPQAPIVFCGVNHYTPDLLAGRENVTGVVETFEIGATLELARRLHPDRDRLYVINDHTATGRANHKRVEEALGKLPPFAGGVVYLENLALAELQERLRALPPAALVLLMSFNRDRTGRTFRYRESIAALRPHCPAPMYGVWSFYLGHGIVGGKLTDGRDHGRAAARMAARILDGAAPERIPVQQTGENRYRFDHEELERFGLAASALPDGSVIVNEPTGFYARHRRLLWTAAATGAALLAVIAALLYALRQRARAEQVLTEAHERLEERVRDRTRALEDANERLQREIRERTDLEDQLVRSERLAAVGTLAGGVAHEFNNINVTVLGFVELALDAPGLDDERREFLERIRKAAKRAKSITHNLLTFSQPRDAPPTSGNLVDVARDTLDLVRRELESRGVDVRTDLQPTPPTVMDAGQIGQVVFNLLTNAQHAMIASDERVLTLATGADEEAVRLSVADTGCGLDAAEMREVFTPFWSRKGEHAREESFAAVKGTGLGLSICHRIVENHGGRIDVESRKGEGSVFTVRLPRQTPAPAAPGAAEHAGRAEAKRADILVVDDESDTRDLLRLVLGKAGHTVHTAGGGEEAMQILWRESPMDIAFVDLQMPQMDGETVLAKMREFPPRRRPVPIVITGRSQLPDAATLDALGVAEVLRKPFEIREIAEALETALRARQSRQRSPAGPPEA